MDFSEILLPNGKITINENTFNRRINEAELFSLVL